MIEARGLTKRFGPLVAVQDVSFTVEPGTILGFIGPNGAGKTTTMRMLTGFLPPSGGSARVAGFDVFEQAREVKRRVGYLPERPPLYPELTVGRYLSFVAEIRELPRSERWRRIGETMERVGLRGWERRVIGSLSKGYRQRVGLAQALVHDPPVLILDEPTSGLDPAQTVGIRELIRELGRERVVVLSTHVLAEVEATCSRAVLIHRGRIAAQGGLDELRLAAAGGPRYRVELAGTGEGAARELGRLEGVERVEPLGPAGGGFEAFRLRAPGADPRPAVARLASERGWRVRALERELPSLEEAFVAIVGREDRPARGQPATAAGGIAA